MWKVWFRKVMILKDQGHMSKQMAPSDSLTSKIDLVLPNHQPKCFSSNVMVKDIFLQNSSKHNITRSRPPHIHTTLGIFTLLKSPNTSYPVTIVPVVTEIWPIMWIYQVMTLKVKVIHEGQQYFVKLSRLYPWAYMWSFIEVLSAVSLEKLSKYEPKGGQKKERRKENSWRNNLTDVDTLWRTLRWEGVTWSKVTWVYFEDHSLKVHVA